MPAFIAVTSSIITISGIDRLRINDAYFDAPEPPPPDDPGVGLRVNSANLLFLHERFPDAIWSDPGNRLVEARTYRYLSRLRTQEPGEYERNWPFKVTPRDYQLKVFTHGRHLPNIALAPCALGVGKTKMALDILADKFMRDEIDGVAIVAINAVKRQWIMDAIPAHMTDAVRRVCHVWKGTTKVPSNVAEPRHGEDRTMRIMAFNMEGFGKKDSKARAALIPFLRSGRMALLVDECFLAGTLVHTVFGYRPIELIRPGDKVFASIGEETVQKVIEGKTSRYIILHLSNGRTIRCTENHPFFTSEGWVCAHDMAERYVATEENVFRVWEGIPSDERDGSEEAEILRDILLSEVEDEATRNQGRSLYSGTSKETVGGPDGPPDRQSSMEQGEAVGRGDAQETVGVSSSNQPRSVSSGRQREGADESPSACPYTLRTFMEGGARCAVGQEAVRLSNLLQNRCGERQEDVGHRGGRPWSHGTRPSSSGCEEEREIAGIRVDRVEIVECDVPVATYDLQLEKTPHYYVEGALVHNSSRIKNYKARRTKEMVDIARHAVCRMILTGTPITKGLEDFFTQYQFLDPGIIGLSNFFSFRGRYCNVREIHGRNVDPRARTIVGYRNQEELIRKIAPVSFMIPDTVLGLPPKRYERYEVEMTPEQAHVYTALRDQLVEDLRASRIENPVYALVRLLRMQQVLCGRYYEEVETEDEMREAVPRLLPNNRPEVLANLLEQSDGQAIIWTRFKADIDDVVVAISGLGRVGIYEGETSQVERERVVRAFKAGELDYVVLNEGTGSTGVDGLQVANKAFYYSGSFSREKRWQSEGRIYRLGQRHSTLFGTLVVPNSIDTMILRAREATAELVQMVMTNPDFINGGASNVYQPQLSEQAQGTEGRGTQPDF